MIETWFDLCKRVISVKCLAIIPACYVARFLHKLFLLYELTVLNLKNNNAVNCLLTNSCYTEDPWCTSVLLIWLVRGHAPTAGLNGCCLTESWLR